MEESPRATTDQHIQGEEDSSLPAGRFPMFIIVLCILLITVGISLAAFYFGYRQGKATITDANPGPDSSPVVIATPAASPIGQPVACTLEARICPDGTAVGRSGPNCEFAPCPSTPLSTAMPTIETSTVPLNWKTYTSKKYHFQISYPPEYKALDDAENLYGWPHAVVLLYNGGQSYDIPIEVWDTADAYKQKYGTGNYKYVVKQIGGKYITILNATDLESNEAVIQTFKEVVE